MTDGASISDITQSQLPHTTWAVLGLLSFGEELSGYDLKKWADASLRFFYWAPAVSQVYAELKRLQRLGFVTSRVVHQDDVRNKRVYRITDEGTRALRAWIEESPVDPPVLKHSPMMRLWLGHLGRPDRLREVVRQHRRYAESMASEALVKRRTAIEMGMLLPAAVLQWAERHYANEMKAADELLVEIDRLATCQPSAEQADPTQA